MKRETMKTYFLDMVMVDNGWPDLGHYEYVLCSREKRKSDFWQKILGDRIEKVLWYGEEKPSEEKVNNDILKYIEEHVVKSYTKNIQNPVKV